MEEQRERTPSGNLKAGKSVSPRQNAPGSTSALIVASDTHAEPPASAPKKAGKAKARKSDANKNAEADSPVASIEDEGDMDSSQKTVVDPEVAEALAKREEARKAKSEKMKAITKGTQKTTSSSPIRPKRSPIKPSRKTSPILPPKKESPIKPKQKQSPVRPPIRRAKTSISPPSRPKFTLVQKAKS